MTISLRDDFEAVALRAAAKRTEDAAQARRLLSLAAVYDGATRTEAAAIGEVTPQIVLDWVLKFNSDGPDGLVDRNAPGQPPRLTHAHRAALAAVLESGPIPAVHGVVRWRIVDLCQWLWEEFRVTVAKPTLSRELRAMGWRKLSARPRHHAQAEGAIDLFKTPSPPSGSCKAAPALGSWRRGAGNSICSLSTRRNMVCALFWARRNRALRRSVGQQASRG